MPMYTYTARGAGTGAVSGQLLAQSEASVVDFIRSKGLFVTSVKARREPLLQMMKRRMSPVNSQDLAHFCQQFAALINAGLPVLACLNILFDQTRNLQLKNAIREIYGLVQGGSNLSDAMQCYPTIFSPLMTGMIHAGEVGGVLDKTLTELVRHYSKENELKIRVKTAMFYPAIVVSLAVLVLFHLVYTVLPSLTLFYNQIGVELPYITRCAMAVCGFLTDNIYLIGIVLFGLAAIVRHKLSVGADPMLTAVILRLPLFGSLWQKVMVGRFCRTLATLLHSGIPLLAAMEVVKSLSRNKLLRRDIGKMEVHLRLGGTLAVPVSTSSLFTELAAEMIAVGEKTGDLDSMLEKTAEYYERESEYILCRLTTLLQPLCIAVAAVFVGILIFVAVLPMMEAMTNMPDMQQLW